MSPIDSTSAAPIDSTGIDSTEDVDAPVGPWRLLAVVAVVVAVVINVVVAWSARHPTFPFDEISMLDMSRFIAGDAVGAVRGSGYFPGWAVLLAPIWWFTDNAMTVYRVAIWIGVVIGIATIWPLTLVVRRFGVGTAQAITIAAVVTTLPSRSIEGDYALSERLLFWFIVWAAVAAYRYAERPTVRRAVGFAVLVGLMLFTHARVLPVVGAAVVWMLLMAIRHLRTSLVGAVAVVFCGGLAYWAALAMNTALLGHRPTQSDNLSAALRASRPGLFARVILGQSWYQTVATFGLIGIGLVVLVVLVWRELRSGRFGGNTYLFGSLAAAFVISVIGWASGYQLYTNPWVRLDAWIYGRYVDPFAALLFALALAAICRHVGRWAHAWGAGLTVLISLPTVLWVAREAPTWGYVTPAHIPGILPFWRLLPTHAWSRTKELTPTFTNVNHFWPIVTVVVLVILAVIFALRSRPLLVVVLLLVLATAGSLEANERSNQFQQSTGTVPSAVTHVKAIITANAPVTVSYDSGCTRPSTLTAVGGNYWPYWLLPTVVEPVNTEKQLPTSQIVLSCYDWVWAGELGARRITGSNAYGSDAWVMPGRLQRKLAAEGLLDPLSADN